MSGPTAIAKSIIPLRLSSVSMSLTTNISGFAYSSFPTITAMMMKRSSNASSEAAITPSICPQAFTHSSNQLLAVSGLSPSGRILHPAEGGCGGIPQGAGDVNR